MLLGRVIGTVVATQKTPGLTGVPLLVVQALDRVGADTGVPFVATDATRMAGPGTLVLYESGREAAMALEETFVPVDHAIIGIVDAVTRTDWQADKTP
ncbi:MAG: EutN/CcmL family microcompartment protein [Phycisphaerales bacterium]|nr:EutN/CcmL family microcompartment protein [Phycisphaerales bacterium]